MTYSIIGCPHTSLVVLTLLCRNLLLVQSVYFCRESSPCGCLSSSLIFICKPEPSPARRVKLQLIRPKVCQQKSCQKYYYDLLQGAVGRFTTKIAICFFFFFYLLSILKRSEDFSSTSQEPVNSSAENITFDLFFFCLFVFFILIHQAASWQIVVQYLQPPSAPPKGRASWNGSSK